LSETIDEQVLRDAQSDGRLWVALADDTPVGFALVEVLSERHAHLKEIDVEPGHGRRGVGTALMRVVCDWACRSGHEEVTLTTFRAVRWNMPFYSRLGFEEIATDDLTPELEAIVRDETARGMERSRRVVMRYRPGAAQQTGAADVAERRG
jgi:GNAT superfamily N-acetyltransferase